ncbi:GL18487 [Drosophila persimilis]|uniref:GL18487 n=1 Tax=Drosophila persimilis TaxID=7234 RepID=B4G7H2_DROPE|nr:GL18487 [Drosophila persimilis]
MDNKINCEHNLSNHGGSEGNSCSAVPEDNPFLMVAAVSCSICGGCQRPTNEAKKTDGEQGKAPPKTPPRKGKDLDSKVTYKTGSAGTAGTAGAAGAVGASGGAGAFGGSGGAGAGPTSKNSRKISPAKSRESSKSKKIIGPRDESTASKSARPKKIKDQNEMNNQDKSRKIKGSNSNHRPNKNSSG